ncbi:conserved hypothetical protein [uncultured Defluviicoccus sp.]|uniref:Tyr recombinase domain-containing protein n=1 Tax=metagenome TaxID=256318 RepID=A0A380TCD8_9ZZZZ|nr:conserved hypothetical protein [uncultured Defluviicoccus sp.]
MARLTTKAVEAMKPGRSRREIADDLARGLYLVVQPSGGKSWAVRYRINGKPTKDTIGRYPEIGLADARELARDRMATVAKGVDPRAEREAKRVAQQEALANTVAATAADFVQLHCMRHNRGWKEQERVLQRDILPRFGDLPLDAVRRRDVARMVDEFGDRPQAARVVLAVLRKMFNWAIERGRVEVNPCTVIKGPRIQRRDRVLSDDELRRVWQAAEQAGYPFGPFVQVLLLTGCRRGEIADLRWEEIQADVITIPAVRYKTGRPHVVPLSRLAFAVLKPVPRLKGEERVFPGRGGVPLSGFSKRLKALTAAAEVPFALHDLRRTVRTGLSRLRVPFEVAERVLGHVQSGVSAHYDHYAYLSEKREALEAWARHVESLIRPAPANVVKIGKRRRAVHIVDG